MPENRFSKIKKANPGFIFVSLILLLTIYFNSISCDENNVTNPYADYQYSVPQQTNDGWATTSLNDVGISETLINQLIQNIYDSKYENIHGILIVKDDKLVLDEYFCGYSYDWEGDQFRGNYVKFDINRLHNIHSITKSITSAMLGIAIDNGLIGSIDEKVFSFFPEYAHLNNIEKDKITLKHLLTMSSGLEWNENDVPPGDRNNDVVQLFLVNDPIEYVLAKPVVTEPGSKFYYHSGGVNVLGEIIKKATGSMLDIYCSQFLFIPLGVLDYKWNFIKPGIVFCSGDLEMKPRDIAKFGNLYLNQGIWKGARLISNQWVTTSLENQYSLQGSNWYGYGFLWWLRTDIIESTAIKSYHGYGWGGQRCITIPEHDMVVVFTGGNYVTEEPIDEIFVEYILPAIKGK